jgi:hypothetical protein
MRFTSPTASWNKPVSQFGAATGYLASLKDRFWLYAGYPAAPGSFNVAFQDYSVPIHDLRTATSTNTVRAFMQQEYQSTRPSTTCRSVTTSPGTTSGSTEPATTG